MAELEGFLPDPFFFKLEFADLNGGEPCLRADLPGVARALLSGLPKLRNLTLNTNGAPPARCVDFCGRIADLCRREGIRFGVSLSLHAEGETHDRVVGVPGASERVMETVEELRPLRAAHGLFVSVNCVLTPLNILEAPALLGWSERTGVPVNFTVGEVRERFNNLSMAETVTSQSVADRERLLSLLGTLSRRGNRLAHHAIRYRELVAMIGRGQPRHLACHYALAGLIVGSDGSVYYCKKSRCVGNLRQRTAAKIFWDHDNLEYRLRQLLEQECPSCLPNTFNAIEVQKDLLKLVRLLW